MDSDIENQKISIIVPNWNTSKDIVGFLGTISQQTYPKSLIDIVVIDNGSNDDSVLRIKQWINKNASVGWYGLKLVENKRNKGIAEAYNQGLRNTKEESSIVIRGESDVLWEENVISEIVSAFDEESMAGVIGAKGVWITDGTKIDHAARKMNWWSGRLSAIPIENRTICDCVFGGTFGVRRNVLKKIGEFFCNECFLASELELCTRVKAEGYEVFCVPHAIVKHKIAGSTRQINHDRFSYIDARELVRFHLKYNKGLARISCLVLMGLHQLKRAFKGNLMPITGSRDALMKEIFGWELFAPMKTTDLHCEVASWVAGSSDEPYVEGSSYD